ncbi:MAG: hypothetical protein F6K42_08915 [Leptolyngbya sp. SIO1D8]|nr:hypothetical protein [Leptolyngbya sp. SIO1D8]
MKSSQKKSMIWLSATLLMSFLFSLKTISNVFKYEFIIQDDARQHVVWLEKYLDASLFQGDLISNYFQSVLPAGYTYLYKLLAYWGISPIEASKVIPVFLYTATAFFAYRLTTRFLRAPLAGFLSTSILTYTLLFNPDVSSATPRAFLNLFLLAFLYYLTKQSKVGVWTNLVFLGLYYPQTMLVAAGTGILSFIRLDIRKARVFVDRNLFYLVIGLVAITLVLSGYCLFLKDSTYTPIVTKVQAMADPAYLEGGRSGFFSNSFSDFWLFGGRSGVLPGGILFFRPNLLLGFIALPFLSLFPKSFPAIKQINKKVSVLARLLITSMLLYGLAHLLLFDLHLPSRYTQHSFRIVMAILSGMTLYILLDGIRLWLLGLRGNFVSASSRLVAPTFALLILLYPVYLTQVSDKFPKTGYVVGRYPKIYRFFQEQPKDILIASLSKEAANLPAFSLRSVLVAPEYGIAYHRGYYEPFRQRVKDLVEATFSEERSILLTFIEKYGIDFFMIEEETFVEGFFVENNVWPADYDAFIELIKHKQGLEDKSALAATVESCTALQSKDLLVLDANCVVNQNA